MEEKQLNAKVMTDNIRYSNVNLQKDFLEMGKGLFEYKVSKAFNGKFENFKTVLKKYTSNINAEQMLSKQDEKICKFCNRKININFAFCPKCGFKK